MNVKFSTLFWLFAVTLCALGLYSVKYKVQAVREQVAEASRSLAQERQALHMAQAEWSYLSRPQRLQRLAGKHLKLAPLRGEQMIDLAALPEKPREGSGMMAENNAPVLDSPSSEVTPASAAGTTRALLRPLTYRSPPYRSGAPDAR